MEEIENTQEACEVGGPFGDPTEPHISLGSRCANQVVSESRVIPYIADDMTNEERMSFADHVAECSYCLREVVLWRLAQVIVEEEERQCEQPEKSPDVTELCHKSPPLFTLRNISDGAVAVE